MAPGPRRDPTPRGTIVARVRRRSVSVAAVLVLSAMSARADDAPQAAMESATRQGSSTEATRQGSSTTETETIFTAGLQALDDGRPGDAIADFEALGDRGVVDPVVSFNRALAYAARVRGGNALPGDLGRTALGLEEARALKIGRAHV